MSNWDLMMPGMGLTSIGLAGVVLSYAEIAHTFIDGMHALSGLTMFVGLIFLAAGILDGGVSTSNRAKATTLVVLSIGLGFGMFGLTYNTSDFTITLAGVLMGIAFPSIIIAYLAMKHQELVKPVGSIVAMAGATGIIVWLAFGLVGPDTYLVPQAEEAAEAAPAPEAAATVEMLAGSSIQGNPDYSPRDVSVAQGGTVLWTNADDLAHTATTKDDLGETFDTGLVGAGESYALDTSGLGPGEYAYYCTVHPWMEGTLRVEGPPPQAAVAIPEGAALPSDGQAYYDPEAVEVAAGTVVTWDNLDNTLHTVTSGAPPPEGGGPDGLFDSGIMAAGESYELDTSGLGPGEHPYYCTLHLWMTGTVSVAPP